MSWTPYPEERNMNGAAMNTPTPTLMEKLDRLDAAVLADKLDIFLNNVNDPNIRLLAVHGRQLAMAIRQYANS